MTEVEEQKFRLTDICMPTESLLLSVSRGMRAGIPQNSAVIRLAPKRASDSRGPGVSLSLSLSLDLDSAVRVPSRAPRTSRITGIPEEILRRRLHRGYMARDEAIKVIPNRRTAWIKLRRVRNLNASSDYDLFWTPRQRGDYQRATRAIATLTN